MGKLSRVTLALMLVVSPLLLGSNRAIFWALNGGLSAIAILFFVISESQDIKHSIKNWILPSNLLGLFVLPAIWMGFQLVPGVPTFLAHPVWLSVPDAAARITINPHQTALALLWWLSMAVVFVAMQAGTRRGGSRWFLHLMMSTVLLVAVFGLANMFFGWNSLGIVIKTAYLDWLTGTFVNRNTAASFFVIGLSIASILGIEAYDKVCRSNDRASPISLILHVLNSKVPLYLSIALVIFIATLQTGSRAGIATALVALTVNFILTTRKPGSGRYFAFTAVIVGLMFLAVATNALYERSSGAVDSSWARVALANEALGAIKDRPLLGHGAGTYQSVEPLFHAIGTSSQLVWNHAHNSFLEAAVDLGVPMTIGWLVLAGGLVLKLHRACLASNRFMPATITLFSVLYAESLHALVDFSLQTQAIALYVTCLLGLAVGEVMKVQRDENLQI